MGAVEDRLAELRLSVPDVAAPVASYVPAVRTGAYVYTSGQLPMREGQLITTGKVGDQVSPEEAAACAQQCALNAIAAVKAEIGDLDAVRRVVKVVCFVSSEPGFTAQPQVANGASDLLGKAFGDAGVHARSAVGVPVLPLDAPVEVEVLMEVSTPLDHQPSTPLDHQPSTPLDHRPSTPLDPSV
jgi:enamine deaminase RidA (YjgF/YER057c/UK114 family)